MVLLAMFPPAWRSVMDRRVAALVAPLSLILQDDYLYNE